MSHLAVKAEHVHQHESRDLRFLLLGCVLELLGQRGSRVAVASMAVLFRAINGVSQGLAETSQPPR
jgi:hypothetical protein